MYCSQAVTRKLLEELKQDDESINSGDIVSEEFDNNHAKPNFEDREDLSSRNTKGKVLILKNVYFPP